MIHTGHAWAPTDTPGRCPEGVTPGSAGIFSALSYFVAETPTMLIYGGSYDIESYAYVMYLCCASFHISKSRRSKQGSLENRILQKK